MNDMVGWDWKAESQNESTNWKKKKGLSDVTSKNCQLHAGIVHISCAFGRFGLWVFLGVTSEACKAFGAALQLRLEGGVKEHLLQSRRGGGKKGQTYSQSYMQGSPLICHISSSFEARIWHLAILIWWVLLRGLFGHWLMICSGLSLIRLSSSACNLSKEIY